MGKDLMRKVRIGIIGVGGIANGKHMPCLTRLDNVELVAFCDLIRERAEEGAQKYGVTGAKIFTDYRELLSLEEVEVVHVLTPNSSHAELSIAAMRAGKHVMCEKPMAKTAAEAREMLAVSRETGRKLSIGYQSRYAPENQYLKKLIQNGELGEIYFARSVSCRRRGVPTWGVFLDKEKQGGGPLIDIGTHSLDLTLWLMDNYKPVCVLGSTYQKLSQVKNAANEWGPWDPDQFQVEDSGFGFVKFENGATVIVESSWALNIASPPVSVLCGTKAGADTSDGLRINGEKFGNLYINKFEVNKRGIELYRGEDLTMFQLEERTWIESIVNDTEPYVKAEQAVVVSEILEALYISAESGKAVYF
jgi:predicted dehydrogenase